MTSITRPRSAWPSSPRPAGSSVSSSRRRHRVERRGLVEIPVARGAVVAVRPYAESKVLVERDLKALADEELSPTYLRAGSVLEPVTARYRERHLPLWFRGDGAFAKPELYELLEAEGIGYAIRLPANRVLQERIGHLLTRPLGRPPNKPQVYCQLQLPGAELGQTAPGGGEGRVAPGRARSLRRCPGHHPVDLGRPGQRCNRPARLLPWPRSHCLE